MRLYRGLKNPYRPDLVTPAGHSGTDFTDCPAVALCYAQGARGVVLAVDIDLDEFGPAKVTQEHWLRRDAKRFMIWGRFDQFITAVIPAKNLRTRLRRQGLRNAPDDDKAYLLRAFIAQELNDQRSLLKRAPRSDIGDWVIFREQPRVISRER
jgi:hypothetical protein